MSASSTQDNRPGPATTGVAGTPPGKATADGRSSRRHWPGLLPALFMLAGLAGSVVTGATAGEPATLLFASTGVPAVEPGGGLGITSTAFPGHTFRLTEPAHVTALGGRLTGSSGRSVFAALYRVDTPWTPPDVPGDSRLLASTLLVPASNAVQDVSGPVDLILEPGWYAIVLGLDRHGATATSHQVSLATTGMPQAPMSRGTYSVDPATGATVTHLPRFRLFVAGHWLAPEPQSPQAFVVASAEPWAWTSGGTTLDAGNTYAMRFHLEHSTRIGQVDTWLMNASGSFYAAIFPLAGSWARPPLPNSAGFADQAIASTLIAGQPGFHKASATFDDVLLPPGEYALVLGSGHFGASGSATILRAEDQVLGVTMYWYPNSGPLWYNDAGNAMMRLSGTAPELVGDQARLEFGPTLVHARESRSLTVRNQTPDVELLLGQLQLQGADAAQFSLTDSADCALLPPGDSCQLTLAYHPDQVAGPPGGHQAQLVVGSDHQPALLVVGLSGSALPSAWITPVSGANGVIVPDSPQLAGIGASASFQLQPASNRHLAAVGGTCGGSLDGLVFTTAPVAGDCTVAPVFAIDTYQVDVNVTGNGTVSPAGTITVEHGDTPSFALAAASGHHVSGISSTCSGEWLGDAYLLAPVTSDCTIHVHFAIDTFQVSASAGANGAINPSGTLTVDYGDTPAFSLIPDAGYQVDDVHSDCPGSLAGGIYTLAPVTGDCTLHAGFELAPASVLTLVSGSGQSARINHPFARPLVLRVSNDAGLPVPGVSVSFQGPASGAGAVLPVQATSNGSGEVSVAARANNVPGSYPVQASIPGIAATAVFELANLPPAVTLVLAIDNGLDHIAYGAQASYLVTLRNTGKDPASGGLVRAQLPAQFDLDQAEWFCLDPGSGCRATGSGSLEDDGLILASGARVQYLISAPVLADAHGDDIVIEARTEADHHPPVGASVHNWLVLFRDGFQPAPGSGSGSEIAE